MKIRNKWMHPKTSVYQQILLCSNIHLNLSFSTAPPTKFFHYFNELMLLTRYVTFIYFFTILLLQTVKQTDTQTGVVQFVAHKGILSANLCESVSKWLWLKDPFWLPNWHIFTLQAERYCLVENLLITRQTERCKS